MNDLAQEVMSQPSTSTPDRVGLFPITRVERFKGGMRFIVGEGGFLDEGGFAYSPKGMPPRLGEDHYSHLEGPWYIWVESW
jgi:hypothetical protein